MATAFQIDQGAAVPPSTEQRERRFFMGMALLIAATVATGFGLFLALGISSFGAPWWVHIHAVSFMSWIALYLTQNYFVLQDRIDQHRRLGRIGAILAIWMVLVGLILTPVTIAVHRSPPFFTPPQFLALDWVNVSIFAALVGTGIAMRKRTDWHRRLMLCATICVIAPAWGRILVLSGLMTPWHNTFAVLSYVVIAMIADLRIRGRIHPAYFIGAAAILSMGAGIELLTGFPPLVEFAGKIAPA